MVESSGAMAVKLVILGEGKFSIRSKGIEFFNTKCTVYSTCGQNFPLAKILSGCIRR
jgi:hypothetical protein